MSINRILSGITGISDGGRNTAAEFRSVLTDMTETLSATTNSGTTEHISDTSIHYEQSGITITESQISDLGNYLTSFTEADTLDSVTARNSVTNNSITVSGITSPTFSGTNISTDYIQFNTTIVNGVSEGEIGWNSEDGTLNIGLKGGNAILQVGQEQVIYIKSVSGATNGAIMAANGTHITDGNSGNIIAEKFLADGSLDELYTLGIATEDIANGDRGYITTFGVVRGIDTSGGLSFTGETWNNGDILYASIIEPGALTKFPPPSPSLKIPMAIVLNAHESNGAIFVRPTTNFHINELHDVNISGLTDGDYLVYNTSNSTWENKTIDSIYALSGTSVYNPSSTTSIETGFNVISGGLNNIASSDYGFIGAGQSNTSSGRWVFMGSGKNNTASADYGVIGGGWSNTINADSNGSFIGSGGLNSTSGYYSFIGSGTFNTISGEYNFIGGGDTNKISDAYSFLGGGQNNTITTGATHSVISGGDGNTVGGTYSTISGGYNNTANGAYSNIQGGNANSISGNYGNISGGSGHTVSDSGSFVGGGLDNIISGNTATTGYGTISGGKNNVLSGSTQYSVIGGGYNHTVSANYSTIGGGSNHTITTEWSTISGGDYNAINSSGGATIAGGYNNTISGWYGVIGGGMDNTASGDYGIVLGGRGNTSSGDYGIVLGGRNMEANTFGEIAAGIYGTQISGSTTTWIGTDRLFVLGNGTSVGSRSNAFVILKNGTIDAPSTQLSGITGSTHLITKEFADETYGELVPAPSTSGDTGTAGQFAYDSTYLYVCTAIDTWKRVVINGW